MFNILDYSCVNASFCSSGSSSLTEGYRTTPAMRDPYQYIRSGSYASILKDEITGPDTPLPLYCVQNKGGVCPKKAKR